MIVIRKEEPGDYSGIDELLRNSFDKEWEGELVRKLREQGFVLYPLVAIDSENGKVVGYLMGSRVVIKTKDRLVNAVAAGPFAVSRKYVKHGIAKLLMIEGLKVCKENGESVVIALGPKAYQRFGFKRELALSLHCQFTEKEGFVALDLVPGSLAEIEGEVIYPEAWSN